MTGSERDPSDTPFSTGYNDGLNDRTNNTAAYSEETYRLYREGFRYGTEDRAAGHGRRAVSL